jgi:hypothetical protein
MWVVVLAGLCFLLGGLGVVLPAAVTGEGAQAQLFPVFYKHSAIGALSTFGLTARKTRSRHDSLD